MRTQPVACTTLATAVRFHICVGLVVGVASRTFRDSPVASSGDYSDQAASHVLTMGDCLQVGRSDAHWHSTQVVKFVAKRHRAVSQLVRKNMRINDVVVTYVELPISIAGKTSSPEPTWPKVRAMRGERSILIDHLPEAHFWRRAGVDAWHSQILLQAAVN